MKLFVLLTLFAPGIGFAAGIVPKAPCESAPVPAYAPAGSPPAVSAQVPKNKTARIEAPCAADLGDAFDAVVVLSGTFHSKADAGQLLERLGAISKIQGLRYWSTTDSKWEELIRSSYALEKADKGYRRRSDFSGAEMATGNELFYAQTDNRSKRELVYRLQATAAGPDRIVVQTRNITGFNGFLASVAPGDLRTVQFLHRRANGTWDYYLASAVKKTVIGTSEASLVNRANALYRHVAGQNIEAEPPLAP
ncbi:MAG: hypothetical protein JWO70_2143 [Betaproteobacteria bacterium]|nr:hypothetical protein [Betaproteobacteria bacterium]